MTQKESKQIDAILTWAIIASNRGADKGELLSAFAFDVNLIREGKEPTATKELVWSSAHWQKSFAKTILRCVSFTFAQPVTRQ